MSPKSDTSGVPHKQKPHQPFRRAVFRGLAIVMPPLLTIALFIWAWSLIERYVLGPVEGVAEAIILESSTEVLTDIPFPEKIAAREPGQPPQDDPRISRDEQGHVTSFSYDRRVYKESSDGKWVGRYPEEYVRENYLQRWRVLPPFLAGFILVLYLLGKFVAAGVGRMFVASFDHLMRRLPVISNVYSSVKQVTDFVLTEREIEFNRVVAVQYPRKGIWSVGFVTGESMSDIRSSANEPVLSVLMPTSPMPVTGFTITVLKSEAIDLNITIDQAIQFVVSCGVVVPSQQQYAIDNEAIAGSVVAAITQQSSGNGESGKQQRADERTDSLESGS